MLPECPEGAGGLPPPQVPASFLTSAYYSWVLTDFKLFPMVDHLDFKILFSYIKNIVMYIQVLICLHTD